MNLRPRWLLSLLESLLPAEKAAPIDEAESDSLQGQCGCRGEGVCGPARYGRSVCNLFYRPSFYLQARDLAKCVQHIQETLQ
ncbi:hypothetical protein R3P38DRAFT_3146388 [Favolaschia claudopus]|uniref:Uncharacterized protein n=1 Tax=Favolaschia claudopus TaxID=2862362 RepID=A0AAV9Z4L0_9AGAR